MDPALLAIVGTLSGVIVTGLIGYFLQRDLILRQTRGARTEDLFQKRLLAMQHLLSAIELIERMRLPTVFFA